jgi:hypothetical protein
MIRNKKTRRETIYEASHVECQEAGEDATLLVFHPTGDGYSSIGASASEDDYRDVFVMNANGKTVARYLI